MAAVYGEAAAGHVAGGVAGQQEQGAVELAHLADAAHGDAFDHGGGVVAAEERVVDLGLEIAWRDGVDADAVARPVQGEQAGKVRNGGL